MSSAQTIAYLATAASAITVGGSAPTVAPMYESVEALQAALDTQAVLMDFENAGNNSRGIRALLTAGIEGAEDETAIEDLYLVTPASTAADGKNRVMVEPIGSLTWTASATAVDGGRSGEKVPKSVSTSGTGRLASRTGIEIAVASALPAVATIYDIGPVRYLLRVPRVGTATGISPMGATWR
ncbi:MAG: hypothetical protein NCW75_05600 [Phycisphaera sp.]|nr:MAG: hypothetical protein NCW75_05600 [Phycisphaera sp.]